MTIGPQIMAALPQLRAEAESLMVDTFVAYEPAGVTINPDGYELPGWANRGTTKGKLQSRGGIFGGGGDTEVRRERIGKVMVPVVTGGLHIPLSATMPEIGWEYQCISVGALSDAQLLGRRWRVFDVPAKDFATARRLDVALVPVDRTMSAAVTLRAKTGAFILGVS